MLSSAESRAARWIVVEPFMAAGARDLAVFQPGRFEALYGVIQGVAEAAPRGAVGATDWYIHLERNRAALGSLGAVRPKSDVERREISQGKIVLDGHAQTLNADYVAQTLLLSDALGVSEVYAASLLQEGIAASARWARTPTEVAVLLYYREKLAVLACLKELAQCAYTLCLSSDADVLRQGIRMGRFVDSLLGEHATLVATLLDEVQAMDKERASVQSALQSAAGPTRLGDEIQLERLAWLTQAEQELGHILYLLALARRIAPSGLQRILDAAEKTELAKASSAMPLYLLTALLATLDTTPDNAAEWLARHAAAPLYTTEALWGDVAFLKNVHSRLTKTWPCEGLRRVLLLQWSLFLLEAMQQSSAIATQLGVSLDDVHALAHEALAPHDEHTALLFLLLRVLLFKHAPGDALDEDAASARALRAIDAEFQEHVLQQVEHLLLNTTSTLLPLLRKLQRAEEDAAFAAMRGARPGAPPPHRRYDIEALFDLIALLCADRPESGLPFWLGADRRLSRFLHWALDLREPGQQRALLDMLAALATGEQCAGHCNAFLEDAAGGERRLATWARLFDWIAHYVELFRTRGGSMPPEEMVLLRAFLRVLATVVRYSAAARDSLYLNSAYAPLARLFGLYACPVPVDLKAGILEALGAFAVQHHHASSSKILAELWDRLQQSGVVKAQKDGAAPAVYELESVEAAHFRYPGSTELVRFLTAILPASTSAGRAAALVSAAGHASAVGLPAPPPLVHSSAPYVAYVVDEVFLKASSRMYATPAERWEVSAACLDFMEHCLAQFPLAALLEEHVDHAALTALVRHPGFALVQRILSGTPLLRELFFFLAPDANSAGFEAVNGDRAQSPAFAHAVEQTLRIVLHIFRVQHVFLHLLLPALGDAGGALATAAGTSTAYIPLDVHLLHSHHVVVQIALYANCTHETIAYLGVRALAALARSATFQATDQFGTLRQRHALNRLVGIVEMTGETERVRGGLLAWLESAAPDVDVDADALTVPDGECVGHIQHAILDLLLENTGSSAAAPNLAHLLLGFDGEDLGPQSALLRTLLALVDSDGLAERMPMLAERVYAVLEQLCVAPYSSGATLRFLRAHDFFAAHLARLALRPSPIGGQVRGALVLTSGEAVQASAGSVLAWMRTDAHVLRLAALEVHALALNGQASRAAPLVRALLGVDADAELVQVLGVVRALWTDDREALADAITLTTPAALVAAQPEDAASGARVYDLSAVAQLLLAESGPKRSAEEHGQWLDQAKLVLQWAAAQNTRRSVGYARRGVLEAWREALGIVLAQGLALLPETRAPLLVDVLHASLPLLGTDGEEDARLAEISASGVLALLRALETHGDAPRMVGAAPDRVLSILRALLDAVLRPGTSAAARMDLYLALVCFTQMVGDGESALAQRTHGLLAAHAERLLDVLARDALDGAEVGQTVALTTLAHLVRYEPNAKRVPLGELLVQRGYLRSLVLHLQTLDVPLQDVLSPDPTSLNAQYVYEALLSFLSRVAQTRSGAQQLLDAHLFKVLARVDFVSLRPDANATHDALDDTGFLPAVAERYAALLTPLLQVVLGVLEHTQPTHARGPSPFTANAARQQALALLLAHQDAVLAALRSAAHPQAGVADAEQAALLVTILSSVLPAAEGHALDAMHTAVLTLAATYIGTPPASLLAPQTPLEREDAALFAPTLGGLLHYDVEPQTRASVFDAQAIRVVHRVVRALALYLERASQGTTRAALVPTLRAARADGAARVVAAPTLGAAIAALGTQLTALTGVLQSWERVHAVLQSPESVRADEWSEIARDGLGDESPDARPAALRGLATVATQLRGDLEARLDTVEMLLVLLVRHLRLFLQPPRSPVDAPPSAAEPAALKEHAAPLLLPMVEKMELLTMVRLIANIAYVARRCTGARHLFADGCAHAGRAFVSLLENSLSSSPARYPRSGGFPCRGPGTRSQSGRAPRCTSRPRGASPHVCMVRDGATAAHSAPGRDR